MASVRILLTKIFDASGHPKIGVFEFTELSGEVVIIHEKLPVVGVDETDAEMSFPTYVDLECVIISASQIEMLIDTSEPHGIEDIQGRTQFRVRSDLVRN